MDVFIRAVGLILLTLVLILVQKGRDFAMLVSVLACCMLMMLALTYLQPVVAFIQSLESLGGLDAQMIKSLLKAIGISVTGEIAALVCADSGNAAMGKTVQFLSSAVILSLCIPLLTDFLSMIEEILNRL